MKIGVSFLSLLIIAACASPSLRSPAVVSSSGVGKPALVTMNIERLKSTAFARCQAPFVAPTIEPVPALDPPRAGGPEAEGLVFQEELSIRTSNLFEANGFYFSPRPRAALNVLPMEIFVDETGIGTYRPKTWADAKPDYSSPAIQPPIDKESLPSVGKVLTELIIGHVSPNGDFPQLFDLRSSAYVRFAGYPPQVTGASLRLGAHRIFGRALAENPGREDFPMIRSLFVSAPDPATARAYVLLESAFFCGALDLAMSEGADAEITVDGYWYTRTNFNWKKDPHTGFVAYSSMLFKNEFDTPERESDEAHDSDVLNVSYRSGKKIRHELSVPRTGVRVTEIAINSSTDQIAEWTLANEDRDPAHYADFKPALGETNYDARASYRVTILESSHRTGVSLYESRPDGEYGDNIVAASTLRQNIKKAKSVEDFVRFKYKTTAFFP